MDIVLMSRSCRAVASSKTFICFALSVIVGCSAGTRSHVLSSDEFSGLSGEVYSLGELTNDGSTLFFCCGCKTCERAAIRVRGSSGSMVLVSDLDANSIREFARRVRWKDGW